MLETGVHVIDDNDDLDRRLASAEAWKEVMVCGTLLSKTVKSCC